MTYGVAAPKRAAVGACAWVQQLVRGIGVVTLLTHIPAHAQLSVGASGQASYSYALATPPARGHEPSLELRYTGGNGGALGHGWSLVAGSQISRCAANKAIDGAIGAVDFAATDKLCLNGARLIALDESGNAVVGRTTRDAQGFSSVSSFKEFRLETDQKVRVRSYGRSGPSDEEGPAYFKIWNPDGGVLTLGIEPGDTTSNALIKGTYTRYASTGMSWQLATAVDASGNPVRYFYDTKSYSFGTTVVPNDMADALAQPATPGFDTVLKEIQYGGANKIVFAYSDRANSSGAWFETVFRGQKTVSVRQLDAITAYVGAISTTVGDVTGAVAAHSYKLSYTNGPRSGRLLLQEVKRCAGNAASSRCLPGTSFAYTPGHDLQYSEEPSFNLAATPLQKINMSSGATISAQAADFNGDGRTDLLVVETSGSPNSLTTHRLYRSEGDGRFTAWTDPTLGSNPLGGLQIFDFNGDGLPDLYQSGAVQSGEIFIGTGTGFVKHAITGLSDQVVPFAVHEVGSIENPFGPYVAYAAARSVIFIDVNGDGKLDAITSQMVGNNGSQPPVTPCADTCTRVYLGDGQGAFTEIPTNISKLLLVQAGMTEAGGSGIVDLNGDGLNDLMRANPACGFYSETSGEICGGELISRGDGNFDLRTTTVTPKIGNGQIGASLFDRQGDGVSEWFNYISWSYSGGKVGFYADPAFSAFVYAPLTMAGKPATQAMMSVLRPMDLNGDGRTDFLELDASEIDFTYWKVTAARAYISDGAGTLQYTSALNIPPEALGAFQATVGRTNYRKQTLIGNFTGKSSQEFLVLADVDSLPSVGNKLYTMAPQAPADMLLSVKEGLAGTSVVGYSPAAASNRVTIQRSAVAGEIDLAPGGYIATSLSVPSGVSDHKNITEFAYSGLKADRNGRGSLGYAQIRRQVQGPAGNPITTVSTLSQKFPFIGSPTKTETYQASLLNTQGAQLLSSNVQVFCDAANDASARSAAISSESNCVPVPGVLKRPYGLHAQATAKDLDGTALPSTATTTTVDSRGYVQRIDSTTTHGAATFQSIVDTEYVSDDTDCTSATACRWWIARPSSTTVTKSAPSTMLAVTAGTQPLATSLAGALSISQASPSPSVLDFGNLLVGSASQLNVVLTNPGAYQLSLVVPSAASVSGQDFSFVSTTCANGLLPGTSCNISVRFSPNGLNARSGQLAVSSGAGVLTVSLTGNGVQGNANISPASLTYPATQVASASSTQFVTLNNDGNAALLIGAIDSSGDFAVSSNSCSNLAVGGSCTVGVTFTPTLAGLRTGSLSIANNGRGGSKTVSLSGVGQVPSATITSSLDFGPVPVGTIAYLNATIKNTGIGPVNIQNSAVSGTDFSLWSNCYVSTLAAGASCQVNVKFVPSAALARSGTLTVNSTAGQLAATLTGEGAALRGNAQYSADSLTFSPQFVGGGASPSPQYITITNIGNALLKVEGPRFSGRGFSSTSTGGCSIQVGQSCNINVYFLAAVTGANAATMTIQTDGVGGSKQIALSGIGVAKPTLTAVAFGKRLVGEATELISTLQNTGADPLPLGIPSVIATSHSEFGVSSTTCSSFLPGNGSCTITVRFLPAVYSSSRSGTLSIDVSGMPVTAAVTGSGKWGMAQFQPGSLSFSALSVGSTSLAQNVRVTNVGADQMPLTIGSLSINGDFMIIGNSCSTLAYMASCDIGVRFKPTTTGARTGSLLIPHNGGGPTTVNLSGVGNP